MRISAARTDSIVVAIPSRVFNLVSVSSGELDPCPLVRVTGDGYFLPDDSLLVTGRRRMAMLGGGGGQGAYLLVALEIM